MRRSRFGLDPEFIPIVVTGAPGSGKSTFLSRAKALLEKAGHLVAILEEIPTWLVKAGFPLMPDSWVGPLLFQDHLTDLSFYLEEMSYELLKNRKMTREKTHRVLLIDGGIPRIEAYIGRLNYLRLLEARGLDPHQVLARYKGVIYMVTPAKDRPEHFTTENNQARSETAEEAAYLDDPTYIAWQNHSHLQIVKSTETPEEKIQNALHALTRVIFEPMAIEREHKFLLLNFDRNLLPTGTATKRLEQDYLVREDPKIERRVRAETCDGRTIYFYTEKSKRPEPGSRDESERQIPLSEYLEKLKDKAPGLATIRKTRHIFRHLDQKIELDEFHDIRHGMKMGALAEIETTDLSIPARLPDQFEYRVVTDNPEFKNSRIAELLMLGSAHELFFPNNPTV